MGHKGSSTDYLRGNELSEENMDKDVHSVRTLWPQMPPPVEGYTSVVEWIDSNFENFEQHVQITTLCTSLVYTSGSRVLQCLYLGIHVNPPGRPWQSDPSILSDTLRQVHLGSVYRPTPTGYPPTTPSIG